MEISARYGKQKNNDKVVEIINGSANLVINSILGHPVLSLAHLGSFYLSSVSFQPAVPNSTAVQYEHSATARTPSKPPTIFCRTKSFYQNLEKCEESNFFTSLEIAQEARG